MVAASFAFALVCVTASVRQEFWRLAVPQPLYPVGAVNYLDQQHFRGKVLVPFRVGSYVSWKLFPAVKVSLDSRYEEVYPEQVVADVFRFYEAGPGWQSVLEDYPPDLVLVAKDSPACGKIQQLSWAQVYSDREFELYARPGLNLPVVAEGAMSFAGVFP